MKVLWITNMIFPEAQQILQGAGELKSSGGWMIAAAEALKNKDVILTVAAPSCLVKELKMIKGSDICYYVFPEASNNQKYHKKYEDYWRIIAEELKPDVVHIWGTEYGHGLAYVNSCGTSNVCVDIQGMTSVYYDYYYGGLNYFDIISNITLRDILKGSLISRRKSVKKSGKLEIEQIKKVHYFAGRTTWDLAHVKAINPNAVYFSCNRILRKEFYEGKWCYADCRKHTIFLSQSYSPLKGLHQIIKALPIILREYPDAQLRIPGLNIAKTDTLMSKIKQTGYGKYISKLISLYNLQSHVIFLGPLNAKQMKEEYLKANLFLCPSAIENSPTSLAEAQILGVHSVASFVGGVSDMIPNHNCGHIYRYDDVEPLALEVCRVFEQSSSFNNTEMRMIAAKRHNIEENANCIKKIYDTILFENKN